MFTKKNVTGTDLRESTDSGCNVKKHSLSLKKLKRSLKKATTVAAFIGIGTGLFPAIAQAQVEPSIDFAVVSPVEGGIVTGNTTNAVIDFEQTTTVDPRTDSYARLNLSLRGLYDLDYLQSQGEFPTDITNFDVFTNNENLNVSSSSGTLRTSELAIDPNTGNFPGLSFGYEAITNNNVPYAAFNNDGVRYDFTFNNRSETLTLFFPTSFFPPFNPNDPNNILSQNGYILQYVFGNVEDAGGVQGVVKYPELGIEQRFLVTGNQRVFTQRSVNVPEPTAVATLLGIGAYGTVSLLKRNQRLKKTV